MEQFQKPEATRCIAELPLDKTIHKEYQHSGWGNAPRE